MLSCAEPGSDPLDAASRVRAMSSAALESRPAASPWYVAQDSSAQGSSALGSFALGSFALGSAALGSAALGCGARGFGVLGCGALGYQEGVRDPAEASSAAVVSATGFALHCEVGCGALGCGAVDCVAVGCGAVGCGEAGCGEVGCGPRDFGEAGYDEMGSVAELDCDEVGSVVRGCHGGFGCECDCGCGCAHRDHAGRHAGTPT